MLTLTPPLPLRLALTCTSTSRNRGDINNERSAETGNALAAAAVRIMRYTAPRSWFDTAMVLAFVVPGQALMSAVQSSEASVQKIYLVELEDHEKSEAGLGAV